MHMKKNIFGFDEAFVNYVYYRKSGIAKTLFSFEKGNLVTISRFIDEDTYHISNFKNGVCDFSGEAYSLSDAKAVLEELEIKNGVKH